MSLKPIREPINGLSGFIKIPAYLTGESLSKFGLFIFGIKIILDKSRIDTWSPKNILTVSKILEKIPEIVLDLMNSNKIFWAHGTVLKSFQ